MVLSDDEPAVPYISPSVSVTKTSKDDNSSKSKPLELRNVAELFYQFDSRSVGRESGRKVQFRLTEGQIASLKAVLHMEEI